MTDLDVAIIGAGAAGIAAARACLSMGLSCRIIEAKDRLGGRAFTDTASLGVTWDRGAHWLHSADVNPLTREADRLGHLYSTEARAEHRFQWFGTRWGEAADFVEYRDAISAAENAVEEAARGDTDLPVSAALPDLGRWHRMIHHWYEAHSALPPERLSVKDIAAYYDTERNWPVIAGYGALVSALGKGLPVTFDCPASRIDTTGSGVTIDTPAGTISARIAILTVSTNVLRSGAIRFARGLPAKLEEALGGLPTGAANKVAIKFRREVFGLPETSHLGVLREDQPERHALSFQIRPNGDPLAIAYLGGDVATDLERAGPDAMIAFAMDDLRGAFGSAIESEIEGVANTAWATDPHTLGAYSAALPGHADARATLRQPFDDKLILAGEAVHPHWYSTVQGAWEAGAWAADWAGRRLLGKDEAPSLSRPAEHIAAL